MPSDLVTATGMALIMGTAGEHTPEEQAKLKQLWENTGMRFFKSGELYEVGKQEWPKHEKHKAFSTRMGFLDFSEKEEDEDFLANVR